MYFSSSSPLLKSYFSTMSSFSYLLTSALSLSLNSTTAFFAFSKSFFFFYISCFTINPFHYTKYFTILLILLLFNIFSTSHSFTSFTSIGFIFSIFYPSTGFLYLTTQLTFTTGWILIKVSSLNLTTLVNITSLIIYEPTYWSTSFFVNFSLNTNSFILNIILSSFFHSLTSFLSLSAYLFISFWAFYTFFFF